MNIDGSTVDLSPLKDIRANITTIRLMSPANVDVINAVYEFHMRNRFRSMNVDQVSVSVTYFNQNLSNVTIWQHLISRS